MNRLSTFFKNSDSGVGAFYPTHHIVAVFRTSSEAVRVKKEVERLAPAAIAVTGEELLAYIADQTAKTGLWGSVMRELSRALGTEEQYVEQDIEEAKKGASFVALYCPDEETKASLWAVLKKSQPLAARYYTAGGIEHL